MIITEDTSDAEFQIRAYEPGKITVNNTTYSQSILISAKKMIPDWAPRSLTDVTLNHLTTILDFNPEIVLFGTGIHFKQIPSLIQNFFSQHHLGVEYMDTRAACRTYVALSAEGRKVLAALLIE